MSFGYHEDVYMSTQQQLKKLEHVKCSTISTKETISRLSKLGSQSKLNDGSAMKKPDNPVKNSVTFGGDCRNVNISISGSNNCVTLMDSKGIPEEASSQYVEMEKEVKRLSTFNTWPHSAPVSVNALARAGFFYKGVDDQVQCFACFGIIKDWEFGDRAMGEHKKHFPRCPFVRDPNYKNVPLLAQDTHENVAESSLTERRAKEKAAGLPKAGSSGAKRTHGGKKAPKKQLKSSGFDESERTYEGNPTRQPIIDSAEFEMRLTFRSEYKRLLSFQTWPRNHPVDPKDMAKAGFYFLEKDDIVQCFACFGKIKDWEAHDKPAQEHARHFPNCPFVMGLDVKNEPITPLQLANAVTMTYREPSGFASTLQHFSKQLEEALPQTAKVESTWEEAPAPQRMLDKSKYPQFTGENARLATFVMNWPGVLGITPHQLARAGFFYTGEGDSTKCFYCGGGLKHWESTDEPWTEHAKWFPACPWLLQQRGQTFVNYVVSNFPVDRSHLRRTRSQRQPSIEAQCNVLASKNSTPKPAKEPLGASASQEAGIIKTKWADKQNLIDKALKSRLTLRVIEMGYDPALVREAVAEHLQKVGKEFQTTNDLLEAVWAAEERRENGEVNEEVAGVLEKKRGKEIAEVEDEEISQLRKQLEGIKVQDSTMARSKPEDGGPKDQERPVSPEDIEKEVERLRDEKLCKVCMDSEADAVLLPCTHLVVCHTCASSLSMCPICRQTITSVVKVFKS